MTTKNKIRNWIVALLFATSMGGATLAVAIPSTTSAACSERVLTFPAWYKGLLTANCDIKSPKDAGGLSKFIWTIALNIIELTLQIVGYLAVGYIIRGGFKYMTSLGEAAEVAKAKKIIMDAVIGLVLSIMSVAIVNIVAEAIK
jgi:hypothetical protein